MATVTTTTTTATPVAFGISIDKGYAHTLFGKLNIALLVLNVICFICVASQSWIYIPPQGWFYFVCVTGFWVAFFEFCLALCSLQERMVRIVPWKFGVLVFCALWSFFYMTAASAVTYYAMYYQNAQGWYSGTFFGFIAMVVYGIAAFYRLQEWRVVGSTTTSQTA